MAIRLVATDMDGTLLDSQKRQPADLKAIAKYIADSNDDDGVMKAAKSRTNA